MSAFSFRHAARTATAALFAVAAALCVQCAAQGEAKWDCTSHDFGFVDENSKEAVCSFSLTNCGDSALFIKRVKTTCGCTVASFSHEPVVPGQSTEINVKFTANGRPGPFSKSVFVYTNGLERSTRLTISGTMLGTQASVKRYFPIESGAAMLTRATVPLGDVQKGELKNGGLEVYNYSKERIVLSFGETEPYVSAMAVPDTVPPGATATVTLFLNSAQSEKWGWNEERVPLIVTPIDVSATPHTTALTISSTIVDDFGNLTPEQAAKAPRAQFNRTSLDLGVLPEEGFSQAEITLKNTGKSKLLLRSVDTHHKALTATASNNEAKPGKEIVVTIRADISKIDSNILDSFILVHTNDPVHPSQKVRVVGLKRNK